MIDIKLKEIGEGGKSKIGGLKIMGIIIGKEKEKRRGRIIGGEGLGEGEKVMERKEGEIEGREIGMKEDEEIERKIRRIRIVEIGGKERKVKIERKGEGRKEREKIIKEIISGERREGIGIVEV